MSFCKIFFIQLLFINVDSFVTNNRFNKFTVNSVSDDYLSFISTLGPFISSKSNYNPQSPSGGDYLSSIAEAKPFTSTPVPLPVPVAKPQSSSAGHYLTSIAEAKPFTSTPVPVPVPVAKPQSSSGGDYLTSIAEAKPFTSTPVPVPVPVAKPQSSSGGDYLTSIAEAKPFTSTPVPLPVPVAKSQSSSGGDYLTSIGGNIKPIFKSSYIYSFKPGSMPAVKPTTPPGFQPAPVPSIKPVVKAPVLPGFKYGSMPAVKPSVKPDVKKHLGDVSDYLSSLASSITMNISDDYQQINALRIPLHMYVMEYIIEELKNIPFTLFDSAEYFTEEVMLKIFSLLDEFKR